MFAAADRATLHVSRICDESAFVPRTSTKVTIDGRGTATVAGSDASAPPTGPASFSFFVEGMGLTITAGTHVVHLAGPALVSLVDNTITDSAGAFHLDKDSTGQIGGNTIAGNLVCGINIQEDSYARVIFIVATRGHLPYIIKDNQGPGIIVQQWPDVWISGNEISENVDHSIQVDRSCTAEVYDNDINVDADGGINAANGSGATFDPINNEAPPRSRATPPTHPTVTMACPAPLVATSQASAEPSTD